MGAVAVGATIYFGSEQSRRQIVEVSQAFEYAHELWWWLRSPYYYSNDYFQIVDTDGHNNYSSAHYCAGVRPGFAA